MDLAVHSGFTNWQQIKLNHKSNQMLVFGERGKPLRTGSRTTKLNPHKTEGQEIEPVPRWWKVDALSIVSTLLFVLSKISFVQSHEENMDKEGWEYAALFSSKFHSKSRTRDLVRRRRWHRKMVQTDATAPAVFQIGGEVYSITI